MTKSFLIIIFFVGFFAGMAAGLAWGAEIIARDIGASIKEIVTNQSNLANEISIIKDAVTGDVQGQAPVEVQP